MFVVAVAGADDRSSDARRNRDLNCDVSELQVMMAVLNNKLKAIKKPFSTCSSYSTDTSHPPSPFSFGQQVMFNGI